MRDMSREADDVPRDTWSGRFDADCGETVGVTADDTDVEDLDDRRPDEDDEPPPDEKADGSPAMGRPTDAVGPVGTGHHDGWERRSDGDRTPEVPKPADVPHRADAWLTSLPDRLFEGLTRSVVASVVWRTAALIAGAFAPMCGPPLVEGVHFAVGVGRALGSFNAGRGFTVPIGVTNINADYGLELGFRLCEEHPPPFPSLGPEVSWTMNDVPIPNWLQLDGAEPVRFAGITAEESAARPTNPPFDIETLIRFAAERAYATGHVGEESWSPLVVAYLREVRRSGLLLVQYRRGDSPEVWSLRVAPPRRRRRRRGHPVS